MGPDTTPIEGTKTLTTDAMISMGEGNPFKGAPNVGLPPEDKQGGSPQFAEAAAQVGHYQGPTPPGE